MNMNNTKTGRLCCRLTTILDLEILDQRGEKHDDSNCAKINGWFLERALVLQRDTLNKNDKHC